MLFLRRELRRMSGKLREIASGDTNEKLTLNIADKDAAALAVSINAMFERNGKRR